MKVAIMAIFTARLVKQDKSYGTIRVADVP